MHGEGHGGGEEPGSAAVRDPPAYGAWNVRIVTAGTGEALPGPVALRVGRWSVAPYKPVHAGKWVACRVGVGGGRSTGGAGRTTQPPVREGPLLRRCVLLVLEGLVSAVMASPAAKESGVDSVRALQHALYRAAKADPGATVPRAAGQGLSQGRSGAGVGQRAPQPRRGRHRLQDHRRCRGVRGVPAA
jgi:hypothetical protein